MSSLESEGRTVTGWEEFFPSQRTPIKHDGEVVGAVLSDWSDVPLVFDGLAYPPRMIVSLVETEARPAVNYLVEFERGKAICTGLLVNPRAGGAGLRAQDLAALSPDRLVELALDAAVIPGTGGGGNDPITGRLLGVWWGSARPLTKAERRKHDGRQVTHGRPRLTAEHYQRVASLYVERGTVQAVADAMEASYRTAARWVREARSRGLLPDAKEE